MITDQQYSNWLQSPGRQPIWLAELDSTEGTEYLASGTYTQPGSRVWFDVIPRDGIEFEDRLDGDLAIDRITIRNTGRFDGWLSREWLGHPVRIYLGDRRWPRTDFRQRGQLINGGIEGVDRSQITFSLYNPLAALDIPVQPTVDGVEQPVTFGTPLNVTPLLVDSNLGYIAHADSATVSSLSISAVRDRAGTPNSWTAGDPSGGFRLGQMPTGGVTCDPVAPGGTAAELLQLLCADTDLPLNPDNLAQLPDWPLGIYASKGETRRVVLDQLLEGLGAHPVINGLSQLEVRMMKPPADVADHQLRPDAVRSLSITAVEPPRGELIVRYARNWTVQQTDSLIAAASAADVYRYSTEWLTVAGTLSGNSLAERLEINTPFINENAAQQILADANLLRSVARYRAQLSCVTADIQQIRPGDTVYLTYPRYGLQNGVNALVLSNNLSRSELEVFF